MPRRTKSYTKRKSHTKKRSTRRKSVGHRGGAVRMPSEYFGVESGRYHQSGSPALESGMSAYGKNVATSHGTIHNSKFAGPNLAPSHGATSTQTGGRRKTRRSSKKSKSKSKSKSHRGGKRSKSKSKSKSKSRSS